MCTEGIAEKAEESKQTIESIEEINKEIENMSDKQKEQEKEKGEVSSFFSPIFSLVLTGNEIRNKLQ